MLIAAAVIVFLLLLIYLAMYYSFCVGFKRNASLKREKKSFENSKKQAFLPLVKEGEDFLSSLTIENEEYYIESFDGLRLCARRIGENKKRLIILFHGFRSTPERDFGYISKSLLEEGYDVLLICERAHSKSEGKYITYGIKEQEDCLYWCDFAKERLGYEKIAVYGISMGAATVLSACDKGLNEAVYAIIADCGYTSPADIIKKVLSERNPFPAEFIMKTVNALFIRPLAKIDVFSPGAEQALKGCRLPVLFIHGDADTFVPCEMTKRNFAACASEKELLIIKGADHALSFFSEKETVLNAVTGFLNKYIK